MADVASSPLLHEKLGYPDDHVFVLAEHEGAGVVKATREGVQRVFGDLRTRVTKDDQLLVLLIGHGTSLDARRGASSISSVRT